MGRKNNKFFCFSEGPRKSVADPAHRTGYGNNFGEQPGGGGTVQGQLIVHLLKPLLTKFVESRKEILAHENIVRTAFIYSCVNPFDGWMDGQRDGRTNGRMVLGYLG